MPESGGARVPAFAGVMGAGWQGRPALGLGLTGRRRGLQSGVGFSGAAVVGRRLRLAGRQYDFAD